MNVIPEYLGIKLPYTGYQYLSIYLSVGLAQFARTTEKKTIETLQRGKSHPTRDPSTKQSNGEASLMQELWKMQSTS